MPRNLHRESANIIVAIPSPEQNTLLDNIDLELLGERLRRARLEKKVTQRTLCHGLFTSAYLSSLELGKTRPTYITLLNLADRLDKSVDFFLRQTGGLATELDEEQARVLEVRLALLTAQTTLARAADERASKALETLEANLSRLSDAEQAHYHYLRAHYYNLQNNPAAAVPELEQARKYLAEQTPAELGVLVEVELGTAYFLQRRLTLALTQYLTGLEKLNAAKETVSPNLKLRLLQNIANCYVALNDWQQALSVFADALSTSNDGMDAAVQAELHYNLAANYAEAGDYERACLNLGRSLHIYEEGQAQLLRINTHNTLAQLQIQFNQFEQAEAQLKTALKLIQLAPPDDPCAELSVLVTMALVCFKQDKMAEASSYLEQSLALGESCTKPVELGRLYQTAAEIEAGLDHKEQAESYYRKAIETLQPDQKLASSLANVYHSYGQQLRSWGEIERAFEFMEKAFQQRELGRAKA
jgi:tetratricopeptide (TPR) repeat protein